MATVRALGKAGYRVLTIGASKGLAGASRFAAAAHMVPPEAVVEPDRYRQLVRELVHREKVSCVVPITDRASRTLLGNDAYLGCAVAGATIDAYTRASDKAHVLAVAEGCGIRVPRQVELRSPADTALTALAQQGACVVKPANSVVEIDGITTSTSVRYAPSGDSLPAILALYPQQAYPLLVQERIIGDGVGVFLLRVAGRTLLCYGHRRLREKPPAGGVSTYREAVVPSAELVGRCEALLDALGYSGPAMVEFKRERSSGEHVLMEINARLWGSLQLAIDAGLDFPSAIVALALGQTPPASAARGAGLRSVWELGELDHALALARRSRAELHAPPDMQIGVSAAIRALADHRWSDRPEVFRWSDPMPFAAELARWVQRR